MRATVNLTLRMFRLKKIPVEAIQEGLRKHFDMKVG